MKKKLTQAVAITDEAKASPSEFKPKAEKVQDLKFYEVSTASASTTTTRRNVAGTIERTDRFKNIDEGLVPFRNSTGVYGQNKSSLDIRDAVILCQKCYYNFSIFRNVIDLMTEFSVNDLFFRGGSKQSRDFFKALFKKLNIWELQDKFFREYYRSGNVFLYRFDADVKPADIKKISQVFGEESVEGEPEQPLEIEKLKIPVRYVLLNPADIQMMGALDFSYGLYFKVLTDYELARLRKPVTEEDIAVFKNLPEEAQKQINSGARVVSIPLDPAKVSMIFYKKQDYEPFAVPMGYPVLEDINFKAELKKIDMAISRTMQQIILLVTSGEEPSKGGINQKHIDALKALFANQSVGRTLIADWTTKAEFIIPDIGELLDPKKYVVVDNDINIGLNNVFSGGEKFANQQQKVEIFVARLEQGRLAFLNNFLIPEIKRIAQSLDFKNYPVPYFEDIELKDNINYAKIYQRLMELGILTPEQGLKAIETNTLPDPTTMKEEQEAYKKDRDDGLYAPLIGGAKEETGRPAGSTGPQTTKSISPIGTKASTNYSLSRIKENMILAQDLEKQVIEFLKKTHDIKRMSKLQKEVANAMVIQIVANEEPSKWLQVYEEYCKNPVNKNNDRVKEVAKIATLHQIDDYLAGILLASQVTNA